MRARSFKNGSSGLCNYTQLKDALLQEFKLSANVYLERFNTCIKSTDDTYVSFASKLTGLLDYFLKVGMLLLMNNCVNCSSVIA